MRVWIAVLALWIGTATPAAAQWREASSDHFVVYSDLPAGKLSEFAQTLERYDALLRLVSGASAPVPSKAARVDVYLVPGQALFQKLTGNNSNVAGFYIPRAAGSSAFLPASASTDRMGLSSQTILLHEYAHHFMFLNLPAAYPAWFVEGFAEFNGSTRIDKDGTTYIGGPAMHRANGLQRNAFSATSVVTGMRPTKAIDADEYYARSWLVLHYLTFAPERKDQLTAYLGLTARGTPLAEAAKTAFGDLARLERDVATYSRQRSLPALKLAPSTLPDAKVAIREMGPAASAIMPVKIISRRGVTPTQAKALIVDARRVAVRFPDDAFVQTALAEAEYDARNHIEAEAAADRAIAVDPKAIDAILYKGRAAMARAVADKSHDKARWTQIRAHFVAANRIDTRHPEPSIDYYLSFGEAGEAPTPNAVVGLIEAQRLAPQARDVRSMLLTQYLIDGKLADARRTITPLVGASHGSNRGRYADALAAIDDGDAKAALAVLNRPAVEPASANSKQ